MADNTFDEAVRRSLALDSRFPPAAYDFVRVALEVAVKRFRGGDEMKHVSGQELLQGVRDYALEEYGPMAQTILEQWGITEGIHVGNIVYNLIEVGYFGKSDGDTLEDFDNGFSFSEALTQPYLPKSSKSPPAADS
jgi:uncharacterized repeat protein (TIGR04138 family)